MANIKISDLRLWVHLGCSTEEKYYPQCVSFDIQLTFSSAPKAIVSDDLRDTICYASVVRCIKDRIITKNYNLIEYLANDVYNSIHGYVDKNKCDNDISIVVTVKKMSPPVPDIHGYVSFTYSGE